MSSNIHTFYNKRLTIAICARGKNNTGWGWWSDSTWLAWVDIDLEVIPLCLVLLGQVVIWLNWLGSWANLWNI